MFPHGANPVDALRASVLNVTQDVWQMDDCLFGDAGCSKQQGPDIGRLIGGAHLARDVDTDRCGRGQIIPSVEHLRVPAWLKPGSRTLASAIKLIFIAVEN